MYVLAPILISPNWELQFHVYTNASLLIIGTMHVQNPTCKFDQLVMGPTMLLRTTCAPP
jgi:hypothetical protein